jgi:NAD(P)-dependent dehydrogenase (short-subunit alcohol dehydrogenase family)
MVCNNSSDKSGPDNHARLELPQTPFDFQGRNVIVTGGAGGIGRCISLSYAANGAVVHVIDINDDAGRETVGIINKRFDAKAFYYHADLSDEKSLEAAVSQIRPALGACGLSVLVNNGAIADAHAANLKSPVLSDFDRVIDTNLRGPFALTRMVLPWLEQAHGSIINIASTRAFMSEPDSEAYAASKGGVVSLTHAMALSLAQMSIRVNCISPGWIDVGSWQAGLPEVVSYSFEEHIQHPAGRIGKPSDIAAACLFLSSDDAGFITGANLMVDGGMTRKMIYR